MESYPISHEALLDNLYSGAYIIDKNFKILYWNKSMEALTGSSSRMVLHQNCRSAGIIHVDSHGNPLCGPKCPILNVIHSLVAQEVDVYVTNREDQQLLGIAKIIPFKNTEGEILGALEIFKHIPERAIESDKLKELAKLSFTDPVTGLVNRKYTENKLQVLLAEAEASKETLGILIFQIQDIHKEQENSNSVLNETTLKNIADSLSAIIKNPHMVLARWNTNQFMLVYPKVKKAFINSYAVKLKDVIESAVASDKNSNLLVEVLVSGTISREKEPYSELMSRAENLLNQCNTAENQYIILDI